jgi:glutathione peroxidase
MTAMIKTSIVIGSLCAMATVAVAAKKEGHGAAAKKHATTQPAKGVYSFTMKDIEGKDKSLADYKGKVLLIVNVASKCGNTPQYKGLESMYEKYKEQGLVIVGIPSNEFHGQEPGTNAEIMQFCKSTYDVKFPMMSKTMVKKGPEQTPLYKYLTDKNANGVNDKDISWNFDKFLVGRDGKLIKHYLAKVKPEDEQLKQDLENALKS